MSPKSEVHGNVEEDHVGTIEEALRAKAAAALSAGFADQSLLPAGLARPGSAWLPPHLLQPYASAPGLNERIKFVVLAGLG